MADNRDHQSSDQDAQSSSQETLNQGTSVSFDVEADVPAIANRPMMNAHRKPPDLSQL